MDSVLDKLNTAKSALRSFTFVIICPLLIFFFVFLFKADQIYGSIFLGLQVAGGQILMPILLATVICSKGVSRSLVFVNFCCCWVLSSIVFSLV
jgi:uncharacterized membrane protein (DUF485 family)